jgi:hypothetical protein
MDNLQVEHKIEHGLYCKLDEEESAKYLPSYCTNVSTNPIGKEGKHVRPNRSSSGMNIFH